MKSLLRSIFGGRVRRVIAVSVRPGDDIVITCGDFSAEKDVLGLANALQAQFPRNRLHLLFGFGSAEVVRQQGCGERKDTGEEGQPQGWAAHGARQLLAGGANPGPGGNVVMLTWAADGRVVVVSVPPELQRDAVDQIAHGEESW